MKRLKQLLCLTLACGLLFGCTTSAADYSVAKAEYPQLSDCAAAALALSQLTPEDWEDGEKVNDLYNAYSDAYLAYWEDLRALQEGARDNCPDLTDFTAATTAALFAGREENTVYSPANLYLALAMLAESTDGDTRKEVTDLMGTEEFRSAANALFKMIYQKGSGQTIAANSLWSGEIFPLKQNLADTLAEHYYADSFTVPMGTEEADKAIHTWINDRTGNLLKDAVENLKTDKDTVLSLISTLYFNHQWQEKFDVSATSPDTFTLADGTEITTDFMHSSGSDSYCRGDSYTAVARWFEDSAAQMIFVLPDEGISPQQLLQNPDTVSALLNPNFDEHAIINWALPSFTTDSNLELTEQLKKLGVTKAFDPTASDFTPATEAVQVYLNQVQHAAKVKVDEDGCTAAAFTAMMALGAGMPPTEELDFTLDRPFLFIIESTTGIPLFIGTVYQP